MKTSPRFSLSSAQRAANASASAGPAFFHRDRDADVHRAIGVGAKGVGMDIWRGEDVAGDNCCRHLRADSSTRVLVIGGSIRDPGTHFVEVVGRAAYWQAASDRGSRDNPRIQKYFTMVSVAKPHDGTTAWCSAFVNWCMVSIGIRGTGRA
jgi:hypothetical protein